YGHDGERRVELPAGAAARGQSSRTADRRRPRRWLDHGDVARRNGAADSDARRDDGAAQSPRRSRGEVIGAVTASERAIDRGRRLVRLSGTIPVVLAAILALSRPPRLAGFDYAAYDAVIRRTATKPPDGQVVVVDVDERSLSTIGQWPWRRDVLGRMVARLRELGASTVALDMMFAEADRHGQPVEAAGGLRPLDGSNARPPDRSTPVDSTFARALGDGHVVLGYALTFDDGAGSTGCVLHPVGVAIVQRADERIDAPFFRASGVICTLPALARAAGGSGFLNATPDPDGVL